MLDLRMKNYSTFTFPVVTQERKACTILSSQWESTVSGGWNECGARCSPWQSLRSLLADIFSTPLVIRDKPVSSTGL